MRGLAIILMLSVHALFCFDVKAIADPAWEKVACSQVGYSPEMHKEFTWHTNWEWFEIRNLNDSVIQRFETSGDTLSNSEVKVLAGIDTVYKGDFTAFTDTGRYKIVLSTGDESWPFNIGNNVLQQTAYLVQKWFYYQRLFCPKLMPYIEDSVWLSPTVNIPSFMTYPGGWGDAGEWGSYSNHAAMALFGIMESWMDFRPMSDSTNIPESGNGIPDIVDEIIWGVNWFLSMKNPDNDGFRFGTHPEQYWGIPNLPATTHSLLFQHSETAATSYAVGILGYAYHIIKEFDSTYAHKCLDYAVRGFSYLKERPNFYISGSAFGGAHHEDNADINQNSRMFAAAGMLLATGLPQYEDYFQYHYQSPNHVAFYWKVAPLAASIYLRCPGGNEETKQKIRNVFKSMAATQLSEAQSTPFEIAPSWAYYWGLPSNAFYLNLFCSKTYMHDKTLTNYRNQMLDGVHYYLGRNYYAFSYIAGVQGASKGVQDVFHVWKQVGYDNNPFPGTVVNGPNYQVDMQWIKNDDITVESQNKYGYYGDPRQPRNANTPYDGRYTDNDSWSTNEMDVYWNGITLYAVNFANWVAQGEPEIPLRTTDSVVAVTSISVYPNNIELDEGKTGYVNTTLFPAGQTNSTDYVITSDNDSVVALNGNLGHFTALNPGVANIIVSSADLNHTDTCVVVVNQLEDPVVDAVSSKKSQLFNIYYSNKLLILTSVPESLWGNRLKIYATDGTLIRSFIITPDSKVFNLSDMEQGVYIATVPSSNGVFAQRIAIR